jgi:hypothetical protein
MVGYFPIETKEENQNPHREAPHTRLQMLTKSGVNRVPDTSEVDTSEVGHLGVANPVPDTSEVVSR